MALFYFRVPGKAQTRRLRVDRTQSRLVHQRRSRLPIFPYRDTEKFALAVLPRFVMEILRKYFRVELQGVENIPKKGRVILAPNHSGCLGFDAAMLSYILNRETGRIPRILTLWSFFKTFRLLEPIAVKMGLKEANTENGFHLLRKNKLVIVFPEGEAGSFKSSSERYSLRSFRTGFVRFSLLTGAPIIPTIVIGAEESHINMGVLRFSRVYHNLQVPLPLNVVPLPAKWKIKFLPPVDLSGYTSEDANDKKLMSFLASNLRKDMQREIKRELATRKYVYFPKSPR